MFLRVIIARVLDDALAHFESQVEPAKSRITLLEILHDAQRVQVMVEEKAMSAHGSIERFFPSMPKRRMAEIMHQSKSFGQVNVESQSRGDGARDLRDFNRVRKTVAEVVGIPAGENLSLIFKTPKGASVNHTVAITLKVVSVGMERLRKAASAGVLHVHRIAGQHSRSLAAASTQLLVPSETTGLVRILTGYCLLALATNYCLPESSFANRTLAASSFFCVAANSSESCSG